MQTEVLGNYGNNIVLDATTLKANIEKNVTNSDVINNELPLIVKNKETNISYLINTNGTVILYDENAVARIQEKFYKTLQSAIDSVATDNVEKEIVLLKDTTENVTVNAGQNIKLNLNKKIVTGTTNKDYTIAAKGTLKINGDGKVTGTTYGIHCSESGNLKIINGTYEGTANALKKSGNGSSVTIDGGTFNAPTAVELLNKCSTIINGGTFLGTGNCLSVKSYGDFVINGGSFLSEREYALYTEGSSNVKINKGELNSNKTNDVFDGVIRHHGTGTLTIGNLGDDNGNIIINNNNKNISGICQSRSESTIVFNSGTIKGYVGINMPSNITTIYLNGGILSGTGGTVGAGSGWSVNFLNGSMTNVNVYLKKNSEIILSGRGLTGKESIYWKKYITEIE